MRGGGLNGWCMPLSSIVDVNDEACVNPTGSARLVCLLGAVGVGIANAASPANL
jgi:hypothetical protein